MEDSNKRTGDGLNFSDSPNIIPHQDEDNSSDASKNDEPKAPTTDGIPIAEEDIEFHSKSITEKDNKDLFVKIDKKAARELERSKKKKEEAAARKLQEIEDEKRRKEKQAENAQKSAERKAAVQERSNKEKQILQKIWSKRKIILIIFVIITAILLVIFFVVPNIKGKIETEEQIATQKMIAENKTDMIKIFEKIVGKKYTLKDLGKTAKEISENAVIETYANSGEIYINGTTERITFSITAQNGAKQATNFVYRQATEEGEIQIIKSEDMFYYYDGEETAEYLTLNELLNKHITSNLNKDK